MTPTIVVDFQDADRSRDALALAWRFGNLPGARLVTVSSYDHNLYSRLPRLDVWFAAVRRAMAAAGERNSCWATDQEQSGRGRRLPRKRCVR